MSNDQKYVRLYPERAVAPLRDIMRQVLDTKARDPVRLGTYARRACEKALDDLEALGFPPDEPLFLLRGQDELAPDTVRYYMGIAADRHAPVAKRHDHLYDFALIMERWQTRKLPG